MIKTHALALALIVKVHIFYTGAVSLTFHGIGKEVGTSITGYLFTTVGTTITICIYAASTLVLLIIFLIYLLVAKIPEGHGDGYKIVQETTDSEKGEGTVKSKE